MIPYTPGGITDNVTRMIALKLQEALKQPIVIENKPGANSIIGAAAHLTTELFKQTTGTFMVHVPYKGTAPALQGLMGGDIQILVDVPSTLMPHVRGGKIKALGMFSAKRVPGAQEVPTLPEAGGPAIESSTWLMFLAPAGTPRDIVNRLAQETDKAVKSTDLAARFDQLGIFAGGGTPEQAQKFLTDEIAKWAKVINAAGVKAEQ
ncbi:MAG: tripartite tricarboxylate transporter substrate-binding protein [Burkholderiales bacterium]